MNELKHNAFYESVLGRSTGRVGNSAKRSPKGRVLGSKTHIFQVFRQE
ncbi:hypothetical protein [Leptospira noguchii]|nr:hypothetical protein [Leptospira noguchii]